MIEVFHIDLVWFGCCVGVTDGLASCVCRNIISLKKSVFHYKKSLEVKEKLVTEHGPVPNTCFDKLRNKDQIQNVSL